LQNLGVTPDFMVHHFYPEYQIDSDQELLQVATNWAGDAADLRQQITDYFGSGGENIELLCTENNADAGSQGRQSTSLVNGLYLADSMGQLMKTEFNSYLWWIFENGQDTSGDFDPSLYGWRTYGDLGLVLDPNTRYPTFYAMKLMQYFAQAGDTILNASSDFPLLAVYAAQQASGGVSLLLINKDPANTYTSPLALTGFIPSGIATVRSYGIPQDDAAHANGPLADQNIAVRSVSAVGTNFNYVFPPYSLTLFTFTAPVPALTIFGTSTNTVVVQWSSPSVGWTLMESTDLTVPNWAPATNPISDDGTNRFVVLDTSTGSQFFRLSHP
jgi:hypothetical protein